MVRKEITKLVSKALILCVFVFSGLNAGASEPNSHHEDDHNSKDEAHHESHEDGGHYVEKSEFNTPYIIHHVIDSHDWHLFDLPAGDGKYKPVSIPLPVILFTDGSLHFFMSSEFEHGHAAVEKGGVVYTLDEHGQVQATKEGKEVSVLDLSITKSVLAMMIAGLLLFLIFRATARFYAKNGISVAPKGIAAFTEPLIIFVRDEIAKPNIGEKKYMKFMPYLLTVFFFIWISNLVGLLPLGFNLTGNLMVTFTLAVFTMLLTNLNGNKNYWGHILWMPGVPVPMKIFLAPIELIGVIAKPFALMIRLFANITAGHIIIMSLIGIMFKMESLGWGFLSIPMTLFVSVLELLVAALQAYIFTMLSALFIGTAVQEAHH